MAKQLVFEDEARQPLAVGVSKLARAVVSTLGPRGRNAVLDKGWGAPKITKDGVTVNHKGQLQHINADSVVFAVSNKSNRELAGQLEMTGVEIHVVGDCGGVGKLTKAIKDGFFAGLAL